MESCPSFSDWLPMQLVMWAVLLTVGFLVATLVFHISCVTKGWVYCGFVYICVLACSVYYNVLWCCCRHLKLKPVPNPSKYFPTLHSVHGGHLKVKTNILNKHEPFYHYISPHVTFSQAAAAGVTTKSIKYSYTQATRLCSVHITYNIRVWWIALFNLNNFDLVSWWIMQKLVNRSPWNLVEGFDKGQERTC